MNLTGRAPYQKGQKATKTRKPMRKISKKRAAYHASDEGQADLDYMGMVRMRPCAGCGARAGVKAHHCRDLPPKDMQWIYKRLPGAAMKSHARDTIPLCEPGCHNMFHDRRTEFHRKYGPDYLLILQTRAAVAALGGEFTLKDAGAV